MKVESSIVINHPLDEVFAFAGDFANDTQWFTPVVESTPTSDEPMGVGKTFKRAGRLMGMRMGEMAEVTEYEPGKKSCFKSTSGPIPNTNCRTFASEGAGTRVTIVLEATPGGFFKLMQPMLASAMNKAESNLATLKSLLEKKA
jgi:uncharacterized membrane protein